MLRKIKLYGELAKFLGQKTFEAEVSSAAQAMRFLVVNFPQLEKHMVDRYYKVAVGDWELTEEELTYPNGQEDIKIIPVVGGAGRGFGRFLLGVALIGVGIFAPAAGVGLGGSGMTFGTTSGALSWGAAAAAVGNIGIALALTGVAEMLTPVEKITTQEQDPRLSFNFSGIQNTSRAGVAVPVIYGTTLTGSITVSANLENEQVEV
jgi:predicted phage tail protein